MDTLSTLSGPLPSTFSLQDAFSASTPRFGSIAWYTNGCKQTDGAPNCTAVCGDPDQAFLTLETLYNCVHYIGIAEAYASHNLSSNDSKLADEYVIEKGNTNSSASRQVNSTITGCFDAYCDNITACTELMWSSGWEAFLNESGADPYDSGSSYYLEKRYNVYDFYDSGYSLCGYVAPSYPLNPDIGGIGVYVSYWIQSVLAVLGTFLVLSWGWGARYVRLPSLVRRHDDKAIKSAQGISVTFGNRRLARLTAALAEFQKAQCFFMLAVNIAALANKANGGLLPLSLQQLYDNYLLLASVAISGYLPVTATLLALHMVDMISAYLLALSGCTVALSVATIAAVGVFKPSQGDLKSIQAQASKGNYAACGHMDLTVYCLGYQDTDINSTYGWGILAYCIVVLSYIFAYQLNAFRDPLNRQARPWVLRFASWLGSIRSLQFAFSVLVITPFTGFPTIPGALAILTLAYLMLLLSSHHPYARKIKIKEAISLKCGFDLLAWVLWFAGFASTYSPLSFLLWVTFAISTFQLLRKAYVRDTRIRTWAFKYRQFAYKDQTLVSSPRGNRSVRLDLRKSSTIMIKASITLVTIITLRLERLEKRAASHDWGRKYRRFLVIFLYWTIFICCIVCVVFNFQGLASFQAKVDHRTWSFGQIVAITVWTQPLCEYFHLELRGMRRGFQHRLLPPYQVSATDTTVQPVLEREAFEMAKDNNADAKKGDVKLERGMISIASDDADSDRVESKNPP